MDSLGEREKDSLLRTSDLEESVMDDQERFNPYGKYQNSKVYPKEIQGIVERMEMEPYVRAFSVFAYAKAEKLVLHIQQRFDHDGVAKRIEWEMKKLGLWADLEDRGYIYSDKVLVSSLT